MTRQRCSPQACSRKLTPLRQWFYFDALECLPEEEEEEEGAVTLPETDFSEVCEEDTITDRNSSISIDSINVRSGTLNTPVSVPTPSERHQVRWADRRVWIIVPRGAQEAEVFPGWWFSPAGGAVCAGMQRSLLLILSGVNDGTCRKGAVFQVAFPASVDLLVCGDL